MRRTTKYIFLLITLIGITIYSVYWFYFKPQPFQGIVSGNGRLEATEIDIATKFYGRIAEILVDEGDSVDADQVLAKMDTETLNAQLHEANAMELKAFKQRSYALAIVVQRESECELAKKNLTRSERLYKDGIIPKAKLDQDKVAYKVTIALCDAAKAEVENAEASIEGAKARIHRIKTDIEDCILKAPRNGRVQYRLAEPGEVLPAGGKVLTIIDLNDIYMTIFLPSMDAAKIPVGAEARIVLDALVDHPLSARVSFVASKAQFTPKEVETRTERQKLVFRVKVNVTDNNNPILKPGIPGTTYIRLSDSIEWPEHLK